PGWERRRTRQFDRGRRPRKEEDQAAVTERQWRKAVEFAARAADSTPGSARQERDLSELREVAARVLDAAAVPGWWGRQAGPADARTLLAALQVALRCGHLEVDVDVRRLAVAAGLGKSTTARALMRLCEAGRLVLVQASEGTQSARYRLVSPPEWPGQIPHGVAGTQGIPPLAGSLAESILPSVEELLERVTHRLQVAAHDVWAEHSPTHPHGLGRHLEATYWTLIQQITHLND